MIACGRAGCLHLIVQVLQNALRHSAKFQIICAAMACLVLRAKLSLTPRQKKSFSDQGADSR
jgi:hypothetical protein